jgi:4,5-dihydroxyphthalate decarboxylase
VAVRNDVVRKDPTLPMAVYDMYDEAKRQAYKELETTTSLRVTLPWVTQEYEQTRNLMGEDYWPYGISQNAKELDLLTRYVHEQGLTSKRVDVRSMFHPSTLDT